MFNETDNLRVPQYSYLARYYDRIMNHVDYKQWASYLKPLFSYSDLKVKYIADISCGTGKLLPNLISENWKIYGSDLSSSMLKRAKSKTRTSGFFYFCSDASAAGIKDNKFDVVLMLYDSINYFVEDEELTKLFEEVFRILKKGGLFIFDVVTPDICIQNFSDYHEKNSWSNSGYERHSWYEKKSGIQYNEFTIYEGNDTYTELHAQKIRAIAEWKKILIPGSFEIIAVYDNFTYREADDRSERVHFLCKKKTDQ